MGSISIDFYLNGDQEFVSSDGEIVLCAPALTRIFPSLEDKRAFRVCREGGSVASGMLVALDIDMLLVRGAHESRFRAFSLYKETAERIRELLGQGVYTRFTITPFEIGEGEGLSSAGSGWGSDTGAR